MVTFNEGPDTPERYPLPTESRSRLMRIRREQIFNIDVPAHMTDEEVYVLLEQDMKWKQIKHWIADTVEDWWEVLK